MQLIFESEEEKELALEEIMRAIISKEVPCPGEIGLVETCPLEESYYNKCLPCWENALRVASAVKEKED